MNRLIVAAHPDDEILGVGGTIAKYTEQGDQVYALILGEGQTSRFDRRDDAGGWNCLHSSMKTPCRLPRCWVSGRSILRILRTIGLTV